MIILDIYESAVLWELERYGLTEQTLPRIQMHTEILCERLEIEDVDISEEAVEFLDMLPVSSDPMQIFEEFLEVIRERSV